MTIVGLITEYNPFHNGHLYHLRESKKVTNADYSIAVMSGNYVQRGCPAFIDKWSRAKMALENGVDMVIEIPTYYATSSAELFAHGSIKLLHDTNIVDYVCFGSEIGSMDFMNHIASLLSQEDEEYQITLRQFLDTGLGFATSRTKALYHILKSKNNMPYSEEDFSKLLSSPNNILGIEYLKSLKRLDSSIKPATIQRVASGYHEENISNNISSASGIRRAIMEHKKGMTDIRHTLPEPSYRILKECFDKGQGPVDLNHFTKLLHYQLSMMTPNELMHIQEISEGLENRIYKASHNYQEISQLLDEIGTKRYTSSRLSRALLNTLLHVTKERFQYYNQQGGPQYIKILGARKESREVLFSALKEKAKLPLVTNMGRHIRNLPTTAYDLLQDEIRFSDVYTLGFPDSSQHTKEWEFKHPFIVV